MELPSHTALAIKGVSEIMPIFETANVLVCHYAISKLCQGMCHHYWARGAAPNRRLGREARWEIASRAAHSRTLTTGKIVSTRNAR